MQVLIYCTSKPENIKLKYQNSGFFCLDNLYFEFRLGSGYFGFRVPNLAFNVRYHFLRGSERQTTIERWLQRRSETKSVGKHNKEGGKMDFNLTSAQLDMRKAAREFAEGEFPPIAKECDAEERFPLDLLRKASQLGFIGIFVDEKYGGRRFGFLENAIVMEEFWRVDPGLGSQLMCACFGSEMVLLKGSEEQKRKYLPPICKGEAISAVAVTEPDAGSDVLSVSIRADRKGDGYLINGSKMFISNGDIANFLVMLCLTNPDATSPHERHSVIIIETDRPGLRRNKLRGKMGIRAHDPAEISLNDVWVPEENLIGEEEKGFNCFMEFFNRSRAYVAAQGVGVAQGALEMALRYVKKYKQFFESLSSLEIVQS